MRCTNCIYEENCSLKEIAKDITGCEGHSKERLPKENEVKCSFCGEWKDISDTYFYAKTKKYICIKCY